MTTPKQGLSVVLPAFNEEANLAAIVEHAMRMLPSMTSDFEIITVDDGSVDQTRQICADLAGRYPGTVRALAHSGNRGYGAALRTGFDAATKDLVFFTDSDSQFHFDEIGEFLSLIDQNDMVIGFRAQRRDPWHRTLNSRIGNLLAKLMLGIRVRDINCAYKLFRRDLLRKLPLRSDGAFINTELLAYAMAAGWRFQEVPVQHFPRLHGKQTGANPRVIVKTFEEYFKLRAKLNALRRARGS